MSVQIQLILRELFATARFSLPAAVTLTMKKRAGGKLIDSISASQNFRHFRNRLNAKLLGSKAKRYGGKLKMVVALETGIDGRLHYHAMIDRPHYWSFEDFKSTIVEQWQRTEFGYRHIDVQDHANNGWVDYITKYQQKASGSLLDSIDWTNCS